LRLFPQMEARMTRNLRIAAVFAIAVLFALSTFAQESPQSGTYQTITGTVIDVDTGRSRLGIERDSDKSRVDVETDSVATTYHGFGTVIAGKTEIFTGSSGFSNIRLGDRLRIATHVRGTGIQTATSVTLLGREVAAGTVGVGQTRPPTSATTPTVPRTTTVPTTGGTVEGTIRQLNIEENRIVLETTNRRMMTVRTYRNTPVIYRGATYRLTNLEIGDEVRVEADPRDAQADDITARRIEVIRSVQESDAEAGRTNGAVITVIDGAITRVESNLDYLLVRDDRTEVRVDMSSAEDAEGNTIHARDLRVGDEVEITGSFNRVGDVFLASTVRYVPGAAARNDDLGDIARYAVVTITGTITQTLEDASTLGIRDRESNRTVRVWVTEDFLARNKAGATTAAENLRVNDTVVVKAFRDAAGNLVAQTIRLRNR
jgi:Domain of unknown function (DUF5666)